MNKNLENQLDAFINYIVVNNSNDNGLWYVRYHTTYRNDSNGNTFIRQLSVSHLAKYYDDGMFVPNQDVVGWFEEKLRQALNKKYFSNTAEYRKIAK